MQDVHDGTNWKQQYVYDHYGNRTIDQTYTFGTGIPKPNFTVSTSNNRLGVPSGQSGTMSYDAAGNLTTDTTDTYSAAAVTRAYDAENRMTKETQANSYDAGIYSYDGDGRRVVRNVNGVTTWQVYGMGGELLAEYAVNTAAASPQKEYAYRNGQLLITTETATAGAAAPSALTANPPSTGANVGLSWTAASGATNYRVERKAAGGSFSSIGTTASTTLTDSGATNGSAYLYKVCAADGSGNCTSAYSNVVLGARFNFPTDSTLTTIVDDPSGATVTAMKAAHINELRTAINAVRSLAGLSAATWTHSTISAGDIIYKEDVQELRTKLDEAWTSLGIQTSAYDDSTLAGAPNGTLIKGVHIRQLRSRATSGVGGSGGGAGTSFSIHWLVADQLGTPRMVFDQTGSLASVSRHDYLPFGEELFAGTGGRTTAQGYVGDSTRQHFTSKERDNETGLDYFGARYYSLAQGRFTSVDPSRKSIITANPQSWNRYSYTYNNPLALVDNNGKWPTWIHELIIDRALQGLDAEARGIIKGGSYSVDDPLQGGQNVENSNQHGMTKPGQSQEDAAEKADQFIETEVDKVKDCRHCAHFDRLFAFGRALHTVQDMTSPAHEGYQVWDGGLFHPYNTGRHIGIESGISNFRMGLAVGATLAFYKYTFSQAALQRATGYTPGSANDPSVLAIERNYSLPGARNGAAESEALYQYRLGLQEGLNFDWGRQRGRRSRREREAQ